MNNPRHPHPDNVKPIITEELETSIRAAVAEMVKMGWNREEIVDDFTFIIDDVEGVD